MRASVIGLSGLLLATIATPAFAQDASGTAASSPISVSANVALTSDYRFRGIGFSGGDIAVQGGIDLTHESGFYVGTWASSIQGGAAGSTELDLYGGWSGEVSDGVTANVGLLYYAYPNATPGVDVEYFEPYAKVSGTLGPAKLTVGAAYSWDQKALAGDNIYVYTDAAVGIPNTPVTINGHVGYNDGSLSVSTDDDYMDFSIGADYALTSNLTANVSYVATKTDLPALNGFNDDAVVFTIKASF